MALWLASRGLRAPAALVEALAGLRVDGHWVGLAAGRAALDGGEAQLGDWSPGDYGSAWAAIDANGGLPDLMDHLDQDGDPAEAIFDARLDDVARALIDGDTIDDTVEAVLAVLGDETRARSGCLTAVVAAVAAGALLAYRQAGVPMARWVTEPGACKTCLAREAAGPMPIDAMPWPPEHPHCRCGLAPVRGVTN